jgi:hypothetical protein
VRISSRINGVGLPSRVNGKRAGNHIRRRRAPPLQVGDGRIVVIMPDGTMLTLIGATRLVLGLSGSPPTGGSQPS